jgi:hypothetical protein
MSKRASNVIDHPANRPPANAPPMTAAEVIGTVAQPVAHEAPASVEDALRLQTRAAERRALAPAIEREGDAASAMLERAEADEMDAAAAAYLGTIKGKATSGNGGELIDLLPADRSDYPRMVDTLTQSPDALNAEASRQRLHLAEKAGALTLGVDAAQTIKARNSLERMLAQQLGALHSLAMQHAGQARTLLRGDLTMGAQVASIEAARNANAAAKLMAAFQTGYIALDRVRRGGRQTVKVIYQQVAVNDGGQAVVAGSIKTRGPRKKTPLGRTGGGRRNAL